MKVELISYTPEARELLLFTKQTRLSMDAGLMDEIRAWPEERKARELAYMLGTIQSSWEFVDYVFCITGVSRAFTHQLVRTREDPESENPGNRPAWAQQSQRTVDMSGFEYVTPDSFEGVLETAFNSAMDDANSRYQNLITLGANPQDARAVLPTNVATNIIAKLNLRTMSETGKKRLCTRTQGEFQNIFRAMRLAVLAVHPWAEPFIRVHCAATGVCCFPNYTECPIKPGIFNPDTGWTWPYPDSKEPSYVERPLTKSEIQVRWEGTRFEAVPRQATK